MKLATIEQNLLSIPEIEKYYDLQDALACYDSAGNTAKERRDFLPKLFKKAQFFLNIENMEKTIEILDKYIFLDNNNKIDTKTGLSDAEIKDLSPIGFDLLDLDIPFSSTDLKNAYRNLAKKHHPDLGGKESDMKALNEAYTTYENYLSSKNYNELNPDSNKDFLSNNGISFHTDLFHMFIGIYIDIWELEKAYELISYMVDIDVIDSYPREYSDNDSTIDTFCRQLNLLSEKMTVMINYDDISDLLFKQSQLYQKKYNQHIYFGAPITINDRTKDILDGKEKSRIIITHLLQAENAYKYRIITEKRYKDFLLKDAKKNSQYELAIKKLQTFLADNTFIKLQFDEKIKYSFVDKCVSTRFKNANIYDASTEQQSEYYSTFYMNPEVKSIVKYFRVRVCSYLFSLETYDYGINYIPKIINELNLFYDIYKLAYPTLSSNTWIIDNLIAQMKKLKKLNKEKYQSKYKEIIEETYWDYLPMYNKERECRTSFTFSSDDLS